MELSVQKREILGRKVKALRVGGLIPAELYGRGVENIHLNVPVKEFKKVFKEAGENVIVNVVIDEQKYPVLIQDVSYHPVSDEIQSVDFYRVRMDEKLKVDVPVEFVGEALAVKEKSGILVKALQEVEVEALPADIPRDFKVNLEKLKDIGHSIYVKDLVVPQNVKVLVDPETVIATITEKVTEEEELKAQEEAVAGVGEVKVETEEKKEEREAEKEAPGKAVSPGENKKETPKK